MASPGSFTDYLENNVLNHIFGGADFTRPATLHVGLFTTLPNDAGTGGVEVTGAGYARVAVTNNSTNFPAASGGSKSNGTQIQFAQATASWGNVKGFGIFDASSGGNLLVASYLVGARKFCTVNTATDTITSTSHGFTNGQKIALWSPNGTVFGGLTEFQNYYVIGSATNTFQVSATVGGAAIDLTTVGTGDVYAGLSYIGDVDNGNQMSFPASQLVILLD